MGEGCGQEMGVLSVCTQGGRAHMGAPAATLGVCLCCQRFMVSDLPKNGMDERACGARATSKKEAAAAAGAAHTPGPGRPGSYSAPETSGRDCGEQSSSYPTSSSKSPCGGRGGGWRERWVQVGRRRLMWSSVLPWPLAASRAPPGPSQLSPTQPTHQQERLWQVGCRLHLAQLAAGGVEGHPAARAGRGGWWSVV